VVEEGAEILSRGRNKRGYCYKKKSNEIVEHI
jgi:hypothetical protein